MLTWKDLQTRLQKLSADELEQTATVKDGFNEFYGVTGIGVSKDGDEADGVLDHGHLYLEIDE